MLTKNQILDVIKKVLAAYKTSILDKQYATIQYVDDKAIVEQIPILRIDEDNKAVYVDCNKMGTYKKYFVPNKYANVYSFSFIYTNDDNTETEIVRIGGALTRDDFVLCSKNTSSQLVLVLGNTDKYTYTKSTKAITKGIYGYLAIGNTIEYTPTSDYHPSTKKYVDDTVGANRIDMCTDEEIDSMLASKLIVSEDNDDLVFLKMLPPI